jgi:hypothetical protein
MYDALIGRIVMKDGIVMLETEDDVWISKRSQDQKWEVELGSMMDDMEKEWQDTGSCRKCGHSNYVQPEDSYYCMKYGEFTDGVCIAVEGDDNEKAKG